MKTVTVNGHDHELSPDTLRPQAAAALMQDIVTAVNALEVGTSPDGLELTSTDATLNVISAASDNATTTSSQAAMTFHNTVAHATNDLEFQFTRSDDTSLLKVDKEGDTTVAGALTAVGTITGGALSTAGALTAAGVNSSSTIASTVAGTALITSAATAASITSDGTAAFILKTTQAIDASDVFLAMNNSTDTLIWKVDASGGARSSSYQCNSMLYTPAMTGVGTGITVDDIKGTGGSGTGITTVKSAQLANSVHKVTVTEAALTDADTSQAVTIWTVPAKTRIVRIVADVTAAFTGGGNTAVTMQVGINAGDADAYLLDADVFTAPVTLGDVEADLGVALGNGGSGAGAFPNFSGTKALDATFTSTTGTVAGLDAGSVTFYIECATYL